MTGIYVHLPFCPYLCPYCDFAKWPLRESAAREYLDALYAEIDREPRMAAATLYLGGGTPNCYDRSVIAALLQRLRECFGVAREQTIEVNPELVVAGDFAEYRRAGITRISIGVQSFEPHEIRTLGRKHTIAQVSDAVTQARAAGIESVSIDVMFGVPGQTPASWRATLRRGIELGVDHISAYGLTVEAGTPYAAWKMREPDAFCDDAREADLYALAIDFLQSAGYEHYEISNFARPGHACAHNLNYWANGEYRGFGVGAASYRGGVRWVQTRSLTEYISAATRGRPIPSEAERLEGRRRTGEAIMLALRTAQGVVVSEFKDRYGSDAIAAYDPVVAQLAETGLLERSSDSIRLTRKGRFLANDVCGAFVTFE